MGHKDNKLNYDGKGTHTPGKMTFESHREKEDRMDKHSDHIIAGVDRERVQGADRERSNRSYKSEDSEISGFREEHGRIPERNALRSNIYESSRERVHGADRERRNRSYKENGDDIIPEITNNFANEPFVGNYDEGYERRADWEMKANTPTGKVHGADRERRNRSYK